MATKAVKMRGLKPLQRKFGKLTRHVKKQRTMFDRIGIQIMNEVSDNFENEGHAGKPWRPLKVATIARRRGRSARILQDTGTLRRSFVMDANSKRVKVGSPVVYAPTHEEGNKSKNIPQRKMLPSKERALTIAIEVAENYIKDGIKRSGL